MPSTCPRSSQNSESRVLPSSNISPDFVPQSKGSGGRALSPALRFVILIGVVNLFADMTYEGARSVGGAFLGQLGASAFAVGLVAGGGELIGYVVRLGAGA